MITEDLPLWKRPELDTDTRVADILSRLTLDEKISLLDDESPAIERLGYPKIKYGGEALHGLCNTGRATSFPMPIGLAATFDEELLEKIASATGDEMRAKFHSVEWADARSVTLTVYSPVINILRDPRWGRAQETFGEDPYLTGLLGAAFVRGIQGDHPKYRKLSACAKHLAVHSGPEALRRAFNAEVSLKDLHETYLPAFRALIKAGVDTVMATYNRVNGHHCCAHPVLIGEFLREELGFDGVVLSDGGALNSLHRKKSEANNDGVIEILPGHNLTEDTVETAGLCLKEQLDFELGKHALRFAKEAINRGMISEKEIDRAVRRLLTLHCKLGEWDPAEMNPNSKIGLDVIQGPEHLSLALESARKSIVLLKNNADVLPLRGDRDRVVLVTGPTSIDLQILLGNFYKGASGRLVSILEGITEMAPEGVTITHSQGCFLTHPNLYDSDWFLGLSDWADTVVACVGLSPLMEGEQGECIGAPDGGDKSNIALPEHQLQYLRRIRKRIDAKSKKTRLVVVVTGGSPLELEPVHTLADAVIMAWYPGEQGGNAVGEILWGLTSPSGKLPATFPRLLADLPDYDNYNMKGRTYRFMETAPFYPFGYGLIYSRMSVKTIAAKVEGNVVQVTVDVENTGDSAAEEVLQLYVSWPDVPGSPHCSLKGVQRLALEAGVKQEVKMTVDVEALRPVGDDGKPMNSAMRVVIEVANQAPMESVVTGKWMSTGVEVEIPGS